MKKLFNRLIDSNDSASSKRVITLIMALHFIIASFVILIIAFFVIFYLPKGKIEQSLIDLLKIVLEYDFYIIIGGLGFVTTENLGKMLLEKAKSAAYSNNNTGYGGGGMGIDNMGGVGMGGMDTGSGLATNDKLTVDTNKFGKITPPQIDSVDGEEIKIPKNYD